MGRIAVVYLLWAISITTLMAQDTLCSYSVEGHVRDLLTNEPLVYASVMIQGTSTGTTTDEEGWFKLEHICDKEFDLSFSYVGYKQLVHHHDYHHPTVEVLLVPDQMMLESVIVEAERHSGAMSSGSTEKVDLQILPTRATQSLGEIASIVAGVHTISTGQNVVKPVIHGLHSNRILIVNEGLRHEFQNWGTDHAPEIDPSLAEELEVIKGAATVRYGPDALGGVLLIRAPELELSSPFGGDVRLTGKSNGRSGEATVSLQKGLKWISGRVGGSWLKQGDLHAPEYQLTNTGKEEISAQAGLRLHPLPEMDIEVHYSHFDQDLGILRGSVNSSLDDLLQALEAETPNFTAPFSYDLQTPKQRVIHDMIKASARWVGAHQSFQIQYGHQLNQRQEFDVRRGNDEPVPNIDLELRTQSIDALWQHPAIGGWSGSLGGQWSVQANDNNEGTNTVPFIPNYDQIRYGAYLIESFEWDKHLLEAGIRYDYLEAEIVGRQPNNLIYRNDIDFQNVSATLGYKLELNDKTSYRTNFGTAWRPPNVAELYRFGRHLSFLEYGLWRYEINENTDFISTRNILTEEDRPVPTEVGYKWVHTFAGRGAGWRYEATGYINYIENFIYARPAGLTRTVRGTSPFFIYDQTNALLWGLDVTIAWDHTDRLRSEFRGSYLWSQQVPDKDNFVGQPPPRLDWDLRYQPSKFLWFDDTYIGVDLAYTFRQQQFPRILTIEELLNAFRTDLDLFVNDASDFDIAAPPAGFFMTNIAFHTALGAWQLNVDVQNLFNVRYRTYTDRLRYFADALGRNLVVSLQYAL